MEKWIEDELATVSFGDKRLDARCKKLIERIAGSPKDSIPAACNGYAEIMAAYRLLENPKVSFDKIMEGHIFATKQRIEQENEILIIQDTTSLDYTTKRSGKVLGHLESSKNRGLFLHPSVAVAMDGLVLGSIQTDCWSRDIETLGKSEDRKDLPIEEKESYNWLKSIEATCRLSEQNPGKLITNVADRECDIYECLVKAVKIKDNVKVVIRCGQNRNTIDEDQEKIKIFEAARKLPMLGTEQVNVKQKEKYRNATISVRAGKAKFKAPYRKNKKLEDVEINIVHSLEENPPEGYEAIEWFIITTLEVSTVEQARNVLDIYTRRWNIEIYFKILKQACQIEELQLETKERLMSALALYLIISWRSMFLMTLGRACPNIPADAVFDEMEWKAIYIIDTSQAPPEQSPTLGVILVMIAKQGGYINRNNDPRPGPKALWIGLRKLCDYVLMYEKLENLKTCV